MGHEWDGTTGSRDDEFAALDEIKELFTRDVDLPVFLRRMARIERRRAREMRTMLHRIELHEDWHNGVARWCIDFANAVEQHRGGAPLPTVRFLLARGAHDDESRKVLQQLAREGVASLEILRYPDGSALVRIDNKPAFRLRRSLADLLEILAAPTAHSRDGLVDYKPIAEIARLLGKDFKTRAQRHTLQSIVNKLRTRLRQARVLPEYVHSHPALGYRFALRQASADGRDPPKVEAER